MCRFGEHKCNFIPSKTVVFDPVLLCFILRPSLTLHKTAQCTVCDMNYSSKKSLKRHRQTHSEQERENNPDEIDDIDDVEEDDERLDEDDEMCVD